VIAIETETETETEIETGTETAISRGRAVGIVKEKAGKVTVSAAETMVEIADLARAVVLLNQNLSLYSKRLRNFLGSLRDRRAVGLLREELGKIIANQKRMCVTHLAGWVPRAPLQKVRLPVPAKSHVQPQIARKSKGSDFMLGTSLMMPPNTTLKIFLKEWVRCVKLRLFTIEIRIVQRAMVL
jgi:hypothetical protein